MLTVRITKKEKRNGNLDKITLMIAVVGETDTQTVKFQYLNKFGYLILCRAWRSRRKVASTIRVSSRQFWLCLEELLWKSLTYYQAAELFGFSWFYDASD